jgi:hypothetical protein
MIPKSEINPPHQVDPRGSDKLPAVLSMVEYLRKETAALSPHAAYLLDIIHAILSRNHPPSDPNNPGK